MKILSFDVGIINLAYCIFDSETCKLMYWEVITLSDSSNYSKLYINLIKELDKRSFMLDVDQVLIEKQPSFNPKMRIIAGCLQTYFFIRGVVDKTTIQGVDFFSPKNKLKCYTGPLLQVSGKSKYSQTKKMGIVIAKIKLQEFDESVTFKNIFELSKKKDDLSDCYLQAITYCIFKKNIPSVTSTIVIEPTIKVTMIGIKRQIILYLKDQQGPTLDTINNAPEQLKNQIITKYPFTFPINNLNLNELFKILSLKKLIVI